MSSSVTKDGSRRGLGLSFMKKSSNRRGDTASIASGEESVTAKSKKLRRIRGLLTGESRRERRAKKQAERISDQASIPSQITHPIALEDDDEEEETVYGVKVENQSTIIPHPISPKQLLSSSHEEHEEEDYDDIDDEPSFLTEDDTSVNFRVLQVILLLMDPKTRRFELLQLEFDSNKAVVRDVLSQIPYSVTEEALRRQSYIGVCDRTGQELYFSTRLCDICTAADVLLAIPSHVEARECARLARPILRDRNVIQMLKASGVDTTSLELASPAPKTPSNTAATPAESSLLPIREGDATPSPTLTSPIPTQDVPPSISNAAVPPKVETPAVDTTESTIAPPEEAAPPAPKADSPAKPSVWSKLMPSKSAPKVQPNTSEPKLEAPPTEPKLPKSNETIAKPAVAKDVEKDKPAEIVKTNSVAPKAPQIAVISKSLEPKLEVSKPSHSTSEVIHKEKINSSKDPKGISANDIPKVVGNKAPVVVVPPVAKVETSSHVPPPVPVVNPHPVVPPSPAVFPAPVIPPAIPSLESPPLKEPTPVIEKVPNEVTLQEPIESSTEPVISQVEEKYDGSRRTLFIILIASIAILIQVVHMSVTAPLSPGHTLSPNAFMSKCGYRALLSSSCEESSLIMNEDGVLTMYASDGSLKWEMIGSTCKVVSDTCKNGLTVNADGSLVIGGKRINAAAVYGKPEFSPWPFTVAPKLRLVKGKK